MGETVRMQSSRFGQIEVSTTDVIVFPGLPGFPRARRFVVMDHPGESLFAWLVSLDEPDLAFVIANPWHFFPGYDPPIGAAELRTVSIEDPSELEVAAIAHVEEGRVSLNLAAPLLINTRCQRGMQLISDSSRYGTREALPETSPEPPDAPSERDRGPQREKHRRLRTARPRSGQGCSQGGATE